jgi:hypothetical protein
MKTNQNGHTLRNGAHGAHFINAYGQWTIEGIAA